MIKGAFLVEPLTENKISKIIDLGVNEISLKWEYCNEKHTDILRNQGIKVYAEFSVFVHEEMWRKHPGSRPIDRSGHPMEPVNGYYGVCPNHPKVREEKLMTIASVIENKSIDGLWLDFIRYPCHWEGVRTPPIAEYCFCPNCLEKYEKEVGGTPEGDKWVTWKCEQITGFVKEVRKRIEISGKSIQLGIFAVPWFDDEYGGAIRSIIGQDFRALSSYVDVFGVMAYQKFTGQPINWISDIVEAIDRTTGKSVVPLVQSMDRPEKVSSDEFEYSIGMAIKGSSKGMLIFHLEDLLMNEDKFKILQQVFNSCG
ncbi:MAG: hypothetical protein B6I38_02955 [Anaerolineaceae bacterium 4572_5.1]|nr:MAG: hypothetical protein B5M51_02005 [Anaerolinea sp. 4484_236]OQY33966.1 MAG: hypothetical protein B6I38_02955 [Anaerolineaceae bacterium 4572_5.1]RLD11579.1 MAG: hypothetical protein DRI56_00725 [Chloroflexota bacterium]